MNKVMKLTIEIVVIIAILLAALFGLSKISPNLFGGESKTKNSEYEKKSVSITYEITKQPKDLLSKVEIGDKLLEYLQKSDLGEIVSVSEPKNSQDMVANYNTNSYVLAPIEDLYDINIVATMEAEVFEKYVMVGATDLKIGYTIPLLSDKYQVNGVITGIEILENKEEVSDND